MAIDATTAAHPRHEGVSNGALAASIARSRELLVGRLTHQLQG